MKFSEMTPGQLLAALVEKHGGIEAVERFLKWRKSEDGLIHFSITSDGTTGDEWANELDVSDATKAFLRSKLFKPTTGVTTEIAVLPGELFEDDDRITSNIRVQGINRVCTIPNVEMACLIRRMFSNTEIEAMGLWGIVTMHEPIDICGIPRLLAARRGVGGRCLDAFYGRPGDQWLRVNGFAFVAPQVLSPLA